MLSFLNIIIYSDNRNPDALYNSMYDIHKEHYDNYKNNFDVRIDTYYVKLSEDIDTLYKLEDTTLYVKGKECWIPGILEKTLRAFEYFKNDLHKYDYIIRGNINTLIDMKLLVEELKCTPIKFYGGGHKRILSWLGGGITDDTWYGTEYIEGTSIILTPDAIHFLLEREDLVKKDIIDDVALGIFMREHVPALQIQALPVSRYADVPCFIDSVNQTFRQDSLVRFVKERRHIFYRNKCCYNNRFIDIIQMEVIKNTIKE
jgi:hypothetical protein